MLSTSTNYYRNGDKTAVFQADISYTNLYHNFRYQNPGTTLLIVLSSSEYLSSTLQSWVEFCQTVIVLEHNVNWC